MFFSNRVDAGMKLADALQQACFDGRGFEVIGVAKGGVIVAEQVSRELGLPMQAVCEMDVDLGDDDKSVLNITSLGNGIRYYPDDRVAEFITACEALDNITVDENLAVLRRRSLSYNAGEFHLRSEKVLVCDDGFVSGRSALTVMKALVNAGAQEVALAVPVVPKWMGSLYHHGHKVYTWRVSTMEKPTSGIFYDSFADVSDAEVTAAVARQNLSEEALDVPQ